LFFPAMTSAGDTGGTVDGGATRRATGRGCAFGFLAPRTVSCGSWTCAFAGALAIASRAISAISAAVLTMEPRNKKYFQSDMTLRFANDAIWPHGLALSAVALSLKIA